MPQTVAIIHARGGSKRLPRKNVLPFGGKPLLAYPIELCRRCDFIDRVIVSTDDDEIMDVARRFGGEILFRRPADISEDVPSELVTQHALRFLCDEARYFPDYVVTLTPATPLTEPPDLITAFALLEAHGDWDAVTAVRRAEEHPEWTLRRDPISGDLKTLFGNPLDGDYNVSQNLQTFFYPTGAFWINRVPAFLEQPSLYGRRWGAIDLDPRKIVDIDTQAQFEKAQAIFEQRSNQ